LRGRSPPGLSAQRRRFFYNLLGRAQEATLVLEDDYASGRHARLFPQGSRWFIEDLGSTNGTYLANQQLTRALPVELGVPVRIGKTVIELRP